MDGFRIGLTTSEAQQKIAFRNINWTVMSRAKKSMRSIHFDIHATTKGLRINPADAKTLATIKALSFQKGSALFKAAISALISKPVFVHPDQVDWPRLPDPIGLLTGNKILPQKRRRPKGDKEKRCYKCTFSGDGGGECHEVPCKDK